ncbi:haloalkane dehalogenase [Proteobacteria bacterium 005FR1]|nr:haloalkane dehalogenase [Proteobacteria bacterium 005FR1]
MNLSQEMPYTKKFIDVRGKRIAYVEEGEGDPIVLLHGNPTSSYLWRNVIPALVGNGRVIAPDLIGQGDSEKLPASEGPDRYGFHVAYEYLNGFFEALGLDRNVTLVLHDWGSGLGFHWANEHRDAVKAIAYMEAIVMPVNWEDWPEKARGIFMGFRSEKGEDLILHRNMFIEAVLPNSILRDLSEKEMDHYRAPFVNPEDRQVMLAWPRALPFKGEEPADVVKLVDDYGKWLSGTDIPKLFINAEPGSILVGRQREFCRSWPNQKEVTVKGSHFIQEDSPLEIGRAVSDWLDDIA